ncbi:DUF2785 domain-containing protein [Brevibacillus sp. HB1.3]|uniref:DUF2785 domain-containing protein n=1 Tax=Brevibacillus sp. HB1.3 TaxID=2738842 RepID=UPI001553A1D1|nr:DUF2785 domain-containing protein [Brevibacillus sp. HB1.3]
MSDTRTQLMLDLQRLEQEQYLIREGEQLQDFVGLLLQYIGDPDPELRDNLIYPAFYYWILDEKHLTDEQLRSLLRELTDDTHLFYQIGSEGDQSVFTRTFSALPIALIMRRHRQKPFLELADFQHVKNAMLRYFQEEKDLRGYLSEGGWAHSTAHGADVFVELVLCPESDEAVQRDVLQAIQDVLHNGKHIFNDEEDERLASIVDTMIDKGLLPEQELADWINGLASCAELPKNRTQVIARVNSKNFLRCLYLRRARDSRENELAAAMLAAVTKCNRFAIN